MAEYLYAVKASLSAPPFCGYLKIGRTNNPKSRLGAHQIGCPIPLHYAGLWSVRTAGIAIRLEGLCHREFLSRHIHGEWHEITIAALADFIARHAHEHCIAVSSAFDGSIPREPDQPRCAKIGALAFPGAMAFAQRISPLRASA